MERLSQNKLNKALRNTGLVSFLPRGKKGMELSLNTVVIAIISIIVLVVVIMYFVTHYGGGADQINNIGQGAIDSVNDLNP